MSALGGILAAVEQRVGELLDAFVSGGGLATKDDLKALSDRVAALEDAGGTSTPKTASQTRTRTASAAAGAATAKGKAADAK